MLSLGENETRFRAENFFFPQMTTQSPHLSRLIFLPSW